MQRGIVGDQLLYLQQFAITIRIVVCSVGGRSRTSRVTAFDQGAFCPSLMRSPMASACIVPMCPEAGRGQAVKVPFRCEVPRRLHCANVSGGRSRTSRQNAFDRVCQNAWRQAEVLLKAGFLKCNSGLCTKFGPRRNAFLVEARKQGST